jgi:NADPH:quinone reductase
MRAVVFTGAGGNEVVQVVDRPDPEVGPDDVLIEADVAGMNPADVEQREGRYPAPPGAVKDVPGLEVAGRVLAAGSRVTTWAPGDRVFGLVGGGGLADRVAVHERLVTRVPERLSDDEAAAVPEAYITAHDALRQGGLRPGAAVLVRGATGAVGSAAVQIASAAGATVIDAEAADDHRGRIDIVLELIGGPDVSGDVDLLSVGGRIVVVSTTTGSRVELDLTRLMVRRATIRGTVLRARPLEEKGAVVQAFAREVVPMLADGRAQPAIDSVYAVEDIGRAFDRLTERGKRGKVLVRFI